MTNHILNQENSAHILQSYIKYATRNLTNLVCLKSSILNLSRLLKCSSMVEDPSANTAKD